jgi:hypothetical protein
MHSRTEKKAARGCDGLDSPSTLASGVSSRVSAEESGVSAEESRMSLEESRVSAEESVSSLRLVALGCAE